MLAWSLVAMMVRVCALSMLPRPPDHPQARSTAAASAWWQRAVTAVAQHPCMHCALPQVLSDPLQRSLQFI